MKKYYWVVSDREGTRLRSGLRHNPFSWQFENKKDALDYFEESIMDDRKFHFETINHAMNTIKKNNEILKNVKELRKELED